MSTVITCPRIQPCQQDAVNKSQFVAFLKGQNERLSGECSDLCEALHEIKHHLLHGDQEAALWCVETAFNSGATK
jgi:hypothetical protein